MMQNNNKGMNNMQIIGLTGNSGCGKSTVSNILCEFGAYIIDADKIAHDIIKKGNTAYIEIIKLFGNDILNQENEIDRKKLAEIVFNNKEKLELLTSLTHKYIIEYIKEDIKNILSSNLNYRYIVIDAPLLIEAGLHKITDKVWVVYADLNIRIERITKRDKITKQKAIERFNNQMEYEKLKSYADIIIENNDNDLNKLKETVKGLL